ncbi:MAG: hypothetical protein RIQ47_1497 [Bacteroidota bacterium]|jgi:hypothetical protein
MELKDIISVPGMGGLHKVIGNNKTGFIVESLVDGKRSMVNGSQRIMTLVDVAIYTTEEEKPLREIFLALQQKEGDNLSVDPKADDGTLRDYFKKIVPNYDADRVYVSDIRKVLNWFKLLNGKVDFSKVEESGESLLNTDDHSKPIQRTHEVHGPKTEGAKTTATKTRKKV